MPITIYENADGKLYLFPGRKIYQMSGKTSGFVSEGAYDHNEITTLFTELKAMIDQGHTKAFSFQKAEDDISILVAHENGTTTLSLMLRRLNRLLFKFEVGEIHDIINALQAGIAGIQSTSPGTGAPTMPCQPPSPVEQSFDPDCLGCIYSVKSKLYITCFCESKKTDCPKVKK